MTAERMLTWLLRGSAAVLLLAVPAAMLPTEWMDRVHAWMGLGSLPRGPIVEYLTRSASLVYAMHGGVVLALSLDVRAHRLAIRGTGVAVALFGAGVLAVDLAAGMPWWWTAGEGPSVFASGALTWWLAGRVPASGEVRSAGPRAS